MPGPARRNQEEPGAPGGAGRSEEPGRTRRSPEEPGGARWSQVPPWSLFIAIQRRHSGGFAADVVSACRVPARTRCRSCMSCFSQAMVSWMVADVIILEGKSHSSGRRHRPCRSFGISPCWRPWRQEAQAGDVGKGLEPGLVLASPGCAVSVSLCTLAKNHVCT